jgi:hypothetical protein
MIDVKEIYRQLLRQYPHSNNVIRQIVPLANTFVVHLSVSEPGDTIGSQHKVVVFDADGIQQVIHCGVE